MLAFALSEGSDPSRGGNMRKVAVLMLAVLVAGLMVVQANPAIAAGKTHDMKGTVVSADVEGKKLTFKDESGTSITAPVLDSAAASLKTVKAGEQVTLTCQDNEKGDHEGISKIVVAAAAKKK
jgi:hypothetical protein